MIQEIEPNVFHNEFERKEEKKTDRVFIFSGNEVLVKKKNEQEIDCPTVEEAGKKDDIYLFSINETAYFLRMEPEEVAGYTFQKVRVFRTCCPKDICFAGETAYHLYGWYRDNQYCGRCAKKMVFSKTERAMVCPDCKNTVYPKIAPAVIVGVYDKNRILMSHYANREYKGRALLAGFCEIGETVEDTVRREVMEETKIQVKNIWYYKSQPWGFDSNLLLGYFCEADRPQKIQIDENELASASFVEREKIEDESLQMSLTAEMISYFKNHAEKFCIGGC